MKPYQLFVYLFGVLFVAQLMSFRKSDEPLHNVFNRSELKTIEKIIGYYDNYVISATGKSLPVEKAYLAFFDQRAPLVKEPADFNLFLPGKDNRISFFQTLNKSALSEIYNIKDTLAIRLKGVDEVRKVYRPYSFSLNVEGKYMGVLKELSRTNEFFRNYYQLVETCGDIGPANYDLILRNYKKIDFSKDEERLVVIIHLLRTGETIKADEVLQNLN